MPPQVFIGGIFMSNKIPCGGFYLDDTLGVDENGKLGVNGGEPYKSLVTDGEGGVKWEDRLAYDDSKVVVDFIPDVQYVKVSDEVPSWASIDSPIKYWANNGNNGTSNPEDYRDYGNGSFMNNFAVFITTDNFEVSDSGVNVVFPEKGVYFYSLSSYGSYTTGIASADSDTPEITWDGNIETIKTIDPKYIPSELNEIVLPSSTSGSSKKFKITVDDSGAISATEVTS